MDDSLKLTALPPEKLVVLLQRAGAKHFTPELLQDDLESGAPCNDDGTINFIEYTAWILRKANDYGNESE
jgi:hypothetical protein